MWKEFKEFAFKGNVLDLAIALIIGAAFNKIVSSVVDDIVMPLVGILIGGRDFTELSLTVDDAVVTYGMFIQNVVDFFIIAMSIFIFVKVLNRLKRKEEEQEEEEQKEEVYTPTREEILLTEIRDLLKQQATK